MRSVLFGLIIAFVGHQSILYLQTAPLLPPGNQIVLNPGDTRATVSNKFERSNNNAGGIKNWEFYGNNCVLSVTCPCFNIPVSWNCLESYLQIRTGRFSRFERFCGLNSPNGFVSHSGQIIMEYKPSQQGSHITCFVACTPFGVPIQAQSIPNYKCPAF
ncbi:uncharacterized protein LOC118438009 isoform X2 [Folsomia candida]|uniref:uncharacterized protein LOC118438009 isoform X2 n=1 Tax=Folsomia candida TaxID=158441 RepID=UPI00160509E6|nr:uncharacterized protein LOC118438009 isoform X2 [Folsomia candida]